jgi:uncharacterized protein
MSTTGEVLIGLAIAVGIAGVIIPVLPGGLLVAAAVGVWAYFTGGGTAWTIFAVAFLLVGLSSIGKYVVAERRLRNAGVPRSTMLVGAVAGIVGFFVIPVVGLVIGFVAGVYVAERRRLADETAARRATITALKASGIAILIELAGALLAAAVWVVGLAAT